MSRASFSCIASAIHVLRDTLPGRLLRAESINCRVSADKRRLIRSNVVTANWFSVLAMAPLWRHGKLLSSKKSCFSTLCKASQSSVCRSCARRTGAESRRPLPAGQSAARLYWDMRARSPRGERIIWVTTLCVKPGWPDVSASSITARMATSSVRCRSAIS